MNTKGKEKTIAEWHQKGVETSKKCQLPPPTAMSFATSDRKRQKRLFFVSSYLLGILRIY